jgi:hypothetical protein
MASCICGPPTSSPWSLQLKSSSSSSSSLHNLLQLSTRHFLLFAP